MRHGMSSILLVALLTAALPVRADDDGPALDATLGWVAQKLNQHGQGAYEFAGTVRHYDWSMDWQPGRCQVGFLERIEQSAGIGRPELRRESRYQVDLGLVQVAEARTVHGNLPAIRMSGADTAEVIYATARESEMEGARWQPHDMPARSLSRLDLPVADEALRDRMVAALAHAGELCATADGAEGEPF